jgi:hypothetical protein
MEPPSSEEPPHGQLRDLPNGHSAAQPQATPLVPPYWKHHRQVSDASLEFRRPPPITLEDHTESYSESSKALWAKSVTIEEYAIVKGSRTGVGAYVVWNCIVQTLDVRTWKFLESHRLITNNPQGRTNDHQKEVFVLPVLL